MKAEPSLKQLLLGQQEYYFSLLQVVRLLELSYSMPSSSGDAHRVSVGQGIDPKLEVVRFQASPSMSFPPAEVLAVGYDSARPGSLPSESLPIPVTVTELGLFGPDGTLPLHYTIKLRERIVRGDFVLRDFLDLFNHRFISFYYQAWAKNHPEIGFERARRTTTDPDDFSLYLYSLIGLGSSYLRRQRSRSDPQTDNTNSSLEADALLQYVGLFAQGPRSPSALRGLLAHYFEPLLVEPMSTLIHSVQIGRHHATSAAAQRLIRIEAFIAQYLPLSPMEQTVLGEHNQDLGESVVLGDEVCIENAKFRIVVGPLSFHQYQEFLPPGPHGSSGGAFVHLVQLTRLFVGPELDFDVMLLLRTDDMYGFELGADKVAGAQLGRSTWLINEPPEDLSQDAIYPSTLAESWFAE